MSVTLKKYIILKTSGCELVYLHRSSGSPTFGSLAAQSSVPPFGGQASLSPTQGFGSIQPQQQQSPSFGSFGGGSQ